MNASAGGGRRFVVLVDVKHGEFFVVGPLGNFDEAPLASRAAELGRHGHAIGVSVDSISSTFFEAVERAMRETGCLYVGAHLAGF